jgi:hypothetical protein
MCISWYSDILPSIQLARWEFKITLCSYLNLWSLQDDTFEKLFNAYAKKVQLSPSDLTFTFDGDKINSASTPQDLDLEDDDMIEVRRKSSWWLGGWPGFCNFVHLPEWEVVGGLACFALRSAAHKVSSIFVGVSPVFMFMSMSIIDIRYMQTVLLSSLSDRCSCFLFCSVLLLCEMVRIVVWSIWVCIIVYSQLCSASYRGVSTAQVLIAWLYLYIWWFLEFILSSGDLQFTRRICFFWSAVWLYAGMVITCCR